MVIVTPRFAEKHDYKYNITDKYGVDPTDMEHLVLPAAPGLGKNPGAEHYGAGGVAEGMAGAGAGAALLKGLAMVPSVRLTAECSVL